MSIYETITKLIDMYKRGFLLQSEKAFIFASDFLITFISWYYEITGTNVLLPTNDDVISENVVSENVVSGNVVSEKVSPIYDS